jgi:uncharacterized Zn finger protein (UPF0148 family)
MKVCGNCGKEIATKDGENFCEPCDRAETVRQRRNLRARERRREREAVLRSLGLVKVKGALGGTYWE